MGELRHPFLEPDLGVEAQFLSGPAGGGDDVADVAGAPATPDLGAGGVRAEGVGECHGHVEDGVGRAAGDVVGTAGAGGTGGGESENVGPGDVPHVDEV